MEHQLKHYIKYTCKKCGWQTAIIGLWKDLKPKVCANRKCKTSFLREPSELLIEAPSQPLDDKNTKKTETKKTSKKSSSKKKATSK